MVDLVLMAVKSISNGSGRCEVRDIIHEKVSKSVHKNRIANFILFANIPDDQSIKDFCNIVIFRLGVLIHIRASHTAFADIFIKGSVEVSICKVFYIFSKGKRINLDLESSSCEQCCKIGA